MRIAPLPFYFGIINKPEGDGILSKKMGLSKEGMRQLVKR
jgi:hypothetical protein